MLGKQPVAWKELCRVLVYTLPYMPILDSSSSTAKLIKRCCQKCGQMEIQISDRVENRVGKGEFAPYKQFLLFQQCFQKLSVLDASK